MNTRCTELNSLHENVLNMISSIICCAKDARASIDLD